MTATLFDQIIYAHDSEAAAELALGLQAVPDDLVSLLYQTAGASGYALHQRINALCAWIALVQSAAGTVSDDEIDALVALLNSEDSLAMRRYILAPLCYAVIVLENVRAHNALYAFYQRGAQQADEMLMVARELVAALKGVPVETIMVIPIQPPPNANVN